VRGVWAAVGRQLQNPSGMGGAVIGRLLAMANAGSNRIALEALEAAPHHTVLELGFGTGRAIQRLAVVIPQGHVLGIDRSTTMLAEASRRNRRAVQAGRVHLMQGQFDVLPWQANSVDRILAVHVVYFADICTFREARRVLRPGGRMVVVATDKSIMTRWNFALSSTHRTFNADDLGNLYVASGFATSEISISRVILSFGVSGLLAIANKS
jgi:ubiquinone/menaquinone biosynthesis C-methylase UbiE